MESPLGDELAKEVSNLSLRRRIGLLVAEVVMIATMVAAPASALGKQLGQDCEHDFKRESRQEQCCRDRTSPERGRQERREEGCLKYVRNHH